jgi:hypothetical protein
MIGLGPLCSDEAWRNREPGKKSQQGEGRYVSDLVDQKSRQQSLLYTFRTPTTATTPSTCSDARRYQHRILRQAGAQSQVAFDADARSPSWLSAYDNS